MQKPDGLVVVPPGTEAAFLAPLPVRRLWGVGPKLEEQLARLGVATIGDLAALDPARLERRLGTHGHDLQRLARGEDEREVSSAPWEAKSLGQEHTYDRDVSRPAAAAGDAARAGGRRRGAAAPHGLRARTITLKYRDEDFHTTTHARTLREAKRLGGHAVRDRPALFGDVHGGKRVRLLGIYASHFGDEAPQLELFAGKKEPAPIDRLRDAVAERFGGESITRASLLGRRERRNPSDKPPS